MPFTVAQLDGYQNGVQLYDSAGNIITSVLDGSARRLHVNGAVGGLAAAGAAPVDGPVLVAGSDGTLVRTMRTDGFGRIVIVPTSVVAKLRALRFGFINTSATARVPVYATVYTEQTSAARRSIASSSANDTAAGTGARTVCLTYYDNLGAGPKEEELTLNGTTGVNTVATDIQFIESIDVCTVGSTGSNVGVISLYTTINKGGSVFGSIAATDNETFWVHHYVAAGSTCYITQMNVTHNGTTVGSGALYTLNALPVLISDAVDEQISDFVRLYGQSSTNSRDWTNEMLSITGFARIRVFVTPETSSSTIYRASFNFYEM